MSMLKGLFNKLYVGKNKKDIEKEDMATNPVQIFFEVLGVHIWDLVKLSLLFFVPVLPILIWFYINFLVVTNMGPEESIIPYATTFLLVLIPLLVIAGLGHCGLTSVVSRYARDMHSWLWTDFIAGIKGNWKQSIPMSIINGIVLLLGFFTSTFYGLMGITIMQYIMIVLMLAALAINIYYWPMMVTYAMSVKQMIKYSFTLVILRLPFTLLFGALTLLPAGLIIWAAMYWDIALYIGVILYAVLGFGFTQYMLSCAAQAAFKKHIQDADSKPEEVHKTQSKPKKDEEPKGPWTFLDDYDSKSAKNDKKK